MGPGSQSADITFNSNISNNPFGSVSINPFSPFANGPLTIEGLSPGECQAISLVVNLSPDLLIGQEIEVVLEFESEEACNQQDGQISTFITIDGVPPSSEFSVLVECMNDPPTVLFTAFEPNSDQTTYAWDFGDGNTSAVASPTHTYTQDDTFTVTLTVINECGTSTNSEVIDFDCDDNPSATCPCSTEGNGIVLNDPNIDSYSLNQLVIDGVLPDDEFSACLNLNGTLIVDIDYVFAGAQVIMESEAAIEIQPGIKLKIGNTSSLMGCDALWDGVLVRENAELELSDMSSISDAFQAIHLMNGSSLSCQDVSFRRNYIGIYIPPNANGVMNSISFPLPIIRNTFESDGNLLPDAGNSYNLLFDDMSYTGILANDVLMTIGVSGEVISNTFKGMYNGIRAFKSTIICSRSEFADMVSNDNDIETGHGLYNEDSSIFSFLNIFKNTEYGIRGNKSELKSFQDVFDNFKVGVEMVAAPPGGTISVFDSDFSIYSERAIVVFNSPSATIECLSNTIINTLIFDETFQEAISIFDNGSKNGSLLRLEDNIILLGENQAGITLSNVLRAEVNSNSISFTDDLNFESGWSRGFKMSNCAFTELEGNSVFGASLPSSGFETEDSPNQIFCCNSSSDNQVGMKFSGLSCVNTDLNTNNLERSADAGLSLFNTIIGGQEHKGNLWCNGSAASFIGDLQLVPTSFFEVDESDGTVDCLILPPANISGWFFDEDAVTPECIEECEFETGEGRSPEFFDLLAANQAFEGEFNETSNWNSGRYLLNSSELLQGQNEEIDLFYAENQNSALQLYNDFQANLESLFELNADLKDQIQILQNDISLILEQINDINFEIIQASTETEKLALINEKNQREFLLKDQYSLLRNLREEIKNGIISSAQDLKSLNFNLPTPNVAATNEKTINNAVLSSIIDPSFLQKVKVLSRIYNIANQCPASGGLAVYKARSLFDYITPGIQNEYTETDNCYQPSENRISLFEDSINIQENTSIEIYPNPNTGTFTVLIEEGIDNGVLTITNMLGERILNYNINTDMKQLDLNINQNPGLYFVTIENNGEIIKNIKLIVQ